MADSLKRTDCTYIAGSDDDADVLTGRVVLAGEPGRTVAYRLWPAEDGVWGGSFAASNLHTAAEFLRTHRDGTIALGEGKVFHFSVIQFSPPAIFRVSGRVIQSG